MNAIIDSRTVQSRTSEERNQIMKYAFGETFMQSEDKGSIQEY
jgi:hypothetical protein